jgi:hypothetical protein
LKLEEKGGGKMFSKIISMIVGSFLAVMGLLTSPRVAAAAYTALINSSDFTGIQTDVSTAVAGIISVSLIILGAAILLRAFRG